MRFKYCKGLVAIAHGKVAFEELQDYSMNLTARKFLQAYMGHIQENAADCVREMLKEFSVTQGLPQVGTVYGEDQMDDGSIIKLSVTIDREKGSAAFDFSGTGARFLPCSITV